MEDLLQDKVWDFLVVGNAIWVTNESDMFMRLFNDIFTPHSGKFMVIYLDDILVFSKFWAKHFQHICSVHEYYRNLDFR